MVLQMQKLLRFRILLFQFDCEKNIAEESESCVFRHLERYFQSIARKWRNIKWHLGPRQKKFLCKCQNESWWNVFAEIRLSSSLPEVKVHARKTGNPDSTKHGSRFNDASNVSNELLSAAGTSFKTDKVADDNKICLEFVYQFSNKEET